MRLIAAALLMVVTRTHVLFAQVGALRAPRAESPYARGFTLEMRPRDAANSRIRQWVQSNSGQTDHSVRNGAIIGGLVGLVSGVIAGASIETGCLQSAPPPGSPPTNCHDTARQLSHMAGYGALGASGGAVIGALVGATVAKVRH